MQKMMSGSQFGAGYGGNFGQFQGMNQMGMHPMAQSEFNGYNMMERNFSGAQYPMMNQGPHL